MIWKELDIVQCREMVKKDEHDEILPLEVENDGIYGELSKKLTNRFKKYLPEGNITKPYNIDYRFACDLYSVLNDEYGFTLRDAANDGIWRYIAMKVMPNLVRIRWNGYKPDHLYSKSIRIYPKQLWWYVHLSWQGDMKSTYELLSKSRFTTDVIQAVVERPGIGYNIDMVRKLMKEFGKVDETKLKIPFRDFVRRVMILNTALVQTSIPELYDGGIDGYIHYLFSSFMK